MLTGLAGALSSGLYTATSVRPAGRVLDPGVHAGVSRMATFLTSV